jgi:hypothetical protein
MQRGAPCSFLIERLFNIERHGPVVQPYNGAQYK